MDHLYNIQKTMPHSTQHRTLRKPPKTTRHQRATQRHIPTRTPRTKNPRTPPQQHLDPNTSRKKTIQPTKMATMDLHRITMIQPTPPNGNGGIVPPWLQPPPLHPDTPRIMHTNKHTTTFARDLIDTYTHGRPRTIRQGKLADGYENKVPGHITGIYQQRAKLAALHNYTITKKEHEQTNQTQR
jgi:hypothetical protein